MREISARICTRSFASRFESGSSMRNTCGSRTIARPIATRWRWPPESWPGFRLRWSTRPMMRAVSAIRSAGFRLRHLPHPQREADVLGNRHVRVQRVVLEHHGDVARARRQVVHDAVADLDLAVGDLLETGDHAQGGRLAAAGRADEHDELAVLDVEVQVGDGAVAVAVGLGDVVEGDCGHRDLPTPSPRPRTRS